ncbi:hypothetical protein BDR26DRAFT_897247 [Obelidium mucronatum]|nr:hypothetical protein BDR26DRAFT_897247 [Obelidium mucronatum]
MLPDRLEPHLPFMNTISYVTHEGNNYRTWWWSQGDLPSPTNPNNAWKYEGPCGVLKPSTTTTTTYYNDNNKANDHDYNDDHNEANHKYYHDNNNKANYKYYHNNYN